MKRRGVISIGLVLLCILLLPVLSGNGDAMVAGDCEVCHGLYPGMMDRGGPGKTLRYVLQGRMCVDCHSSADRDTIKMIGGARVPVVNSMVEPDHALAGGNFYYVKVFGDRRGHNVEGIVAGDEKNGFVPPGYDRFSDPSDTGFDTSRPLACAGSNGCHGDRNVPNPFAAIFGAHHGDDSSIDGTVTARSYRFLRRTGKVRGVVGLEDEDWEQDVSPGKHNEYTPSINRFCADCHSDLYRREGIGRQSPWLRHPTGIVLPKRGEYLMYNPDVTPPADMPGVRVYSVSAPVARPSLPEGVSAVVRPGRDVVMCLSCHVAHGSPNEYMLRWDYDAVVSGEDGHGGCFVCHTGKGE